MKTIGSLLGIFIIILAVSCSMVSGLDGTSTTFNSSFTLQDFTYNGTHTLYVLLAPYEADVFYYFDSPEEEIWRFGTSIDQTGTFDLSIDPIEFEDINYGETIFFDAFLFIASDEDDSGDFTSGDLVMPAYRVQIEDGEPYVLSDMTFDVAGLEAGPRAFDLRVTIESSLSEDSVSSTNPVYLLINNADDPDFTVTTNLFRQFVITDGRLLDDMYVLSIPAVADTYRLLIVHDTNGDGVGPGDYASEADRTAVTASFTNSGTNSYEQIFLTIDTSVTLTN